MIESKLLASSGQVKTKDVLNEKWAWIHELKFAQKGQTLGEMMTQIFQDITMLKEENKALKTDNINLTNQVEHMSNDMENMRNEITALKGLKVGI